MSRPTTSHPATAREIILEIVRNMREGLEPLQYSTLPPAIYHVYLHPDDVESLRGILPRIVDEARRALNAELETLNGGGQVRILENTDDGIEPGDISIYSELALPAKDDLDAGSMTKRITTRRLAGVESVSQSYDKPAPAPVPAATVPAETSMAREAAGAFAVIEYEDN